MNLKKIRKQKGISQMALWKLTGINRSKISHFEMGYLKPNKEEEEILAKALGVSNKELFPEEER